MDSDVSLTDLPVMRAMFGDTNDYCADYIPKPWDPLWINETEMRDRLIEKHIPVLKELYGEKSIVIDSPDPDYLTKQSHLALGIRHLLIAYMNRAITGETFIADIYSVQDVGDQWQVFHDLLDTSYADAAELEMGSPDVGSDAYGRDARLLAAERARALESTFGLTAD